MDRHQRLRQRGKPSLPVFVKSLFALVDSRFERFQIRFVTTNFLSAMIHPSHQLLQQGLAFPGSRLHGLYVSLDRSLIAPIKKASTHNSNKSRWCRNEDDPFEP